jgi:mannose-1-phosphate guanylyltransferase/mannose-6-phosphate isomerase
MLQDAVLRVQGVSDIEPAIVVCRDMHRFLVRSHLRDADLPYQSIILEPSKRGTAPATVIAALEAMDFDEESLMLVLPADHRISNEQQFGEALMSAQLAGAMGYFVTFGVKPSRAETGFGYLRSGEKLTSEIFKLAEFVEKPDRQVAEQYLSEGEWFWNSGIFLFPTKAFLAEAQAYDHEMVNYCRLAHQNSELDGDFIRLKKADFESCRTDSIDCTVMEKTKKGVVVPLQAEWSDLGSWESIWEIGQKDSDGNVTDGDVISRDTRNSYVRSDHRLISTLGVDDLVIVDSGDAVLVMSRHRAQDVQKLVADLKTLGRVEYQEHPKVYRPWGSYESVDAGEGFRIKRITVYPRSRLSLQSHQKRSEHWVVVSGEAMVTKGEEIFSLNVNESTYISSGTVHRLQNAGTENLVLIEVQIGSYFGEDDIVRYDDDFGRESKKYE